MYLIYMLQRELKELLHDPSRALLLLGAASAYMLLFGALYEPGVIKSVPIVILDEDHSALSREAIQSLEDSESFYVNSYAASEEEMLTELQEKNVYMAIHIPADFSAKISHNEHSSILMIVNSSNIMYANTTSSACQDVLNEFSDKLAINKTALTLNISESRLSPRITPVHYEYRVLNNSTQSYSLFFCIGLAMTAFQLCMYMTFSASIQYALKNKAEIITLPVIPFLLIKFLFYLLLSLFGFTIFYFFAAKIFFMPAKAPVWQIYLLACLFITTILSLSSWLAALFASHTACVRAGLIYVVPSFIFSGYTWPLESVSPAIHIISMLLFPLTWVLNPMRDLFLSGSSGSFYLSCTVLLILTATNLLLGFFAFRHKYQKNFSCSFH